MGIDTGVCVEQYFLDVIRKTKHLPGVKCRFRTQAHITGTGGHSLGKGWAFFTLQIMILPFLNLKEVYANCLGGYYLGGGVSEYVIGSLL